MNADSALRALVERQKWFEDQIASAESEWIDFWKERFEDGDDVPDKEHFVSLWLAERCAELLAAPQEAPAEDEQDDRDVPVWTLIKLLKECGGVEDEGENGRFWTLDLNTVYSLEKLLNDYGTDVGYANCRKPLAAPAGMVLVPDEVRRLVGKLAQWRLSMSYNESYFGEPAGLVKSTVAALERIVDPIYPPVPVAPDPLAGVVIYTESGTLAAASDSLGAYNDDIAVGLFAAAMKEKLAAARAKGRGGWDDREDLEQHLSNLLRAHVDKGDPIDVANFCCFLWNRCEAICAAPVAQMAAASKIVAWTEKDGDEWVVYDAEGETGQHIAAFQKDRHFKEIFPIYDAAPAVVVDEAVVKDAARYRFLRQPDNAIVYAKDLTNWNQVPYPPANGSFGLFKYDSPEQLDAGIDAALAAALNQGKANG